MADAPKLSGPDNGKKSKNALAPIAQQARQQLQTFFAATMQKSEDKKLTPAAIVYALAAGVFLIITILYLITGPVLAGILMILPTGILAGFAYRSLQ